MRISDWSSDVCSSDLLRQVARAMDLPITEFLGDRAPLTVDQALLLRQVEDLSSEQLQELQAFIRDRLGIASSVNRHIALIGLRGAANTTLGKIHAHTFGLPLLEIVKEIKVEAGPNLQGMLDYYG